MVHATPLWPVWQALLSSFDSAFIRPGFRRFAEWVTALAINVEEHTITQSVLAIERIDDWKAMERFAEYGAWRADFVISSLTRLVEKAPGGSGTATVSRPSMTPRSTAAARTSGAPARSTSTPPAAPTGPPPSGPTTGSSAGRCCRTLTSPPNP